MQRKVVWKIWMSKFIFCIKVNNMCDRHSWYGGVGSYGVPKSKTKSDLQSVSVATGPLPQVGGDNAGSYVSWCGNAKMAAMQGTMSKKAAERRAMFSYPGLKYKSDTIQPFVSDIERARNFTQTPAPGSKLNTVYDESCASDFSQEKSLGGYMPHEFVHPIPKQELSMTEAQMVSQPYNSSYGLHPVSDHDMGIGGGHYVVDRISRKVEKKPYKMGPSQSFPTQQDAQWAADNLTLPRSMLASKTL